MVTTFKTYFGDYLNGLFVTWESTPSTTAGTSDVTITMNMHLRSKLYVYGYKDDGTSNTPNRYGSVTNESGGTYVPDQDASDTLYPNDTFINWDDGGTPVGTTSAA